MTTLDADQSINVQLLLTGNELMTGVTTDSNSAMIAERLANIGLPIHRKVTVGDDIEVLVDEIDRLTACSDVVIVNGGLGPTLDDLTAEALSRVVRQPLVVFQAAMNHLQQWCVERSYPLNDANKKQAYLPKNATIINNSVGSAVGFAIEWNDCVVLCTPGVPSELRMMLDEEIVGLLQARFPRSIAPDITRMQVFGLGESGLQQMFLDSFPEWPKEVEVSFRAGAPTLELKLTTFHEDHRGIKTQWKQKLLAKIGDSVIGEGTTSLQQELVALLAQTNKTLTTVESCTGGLIASKITEVSGASAVFEAGFVTYSNAMKEALVDVSSETIHQHGAVSEAVVEEMVRGALKVSGADLGVAVSGVAGPGGGSALKPVGTVCIAWGGADKIYTRRLLINRDRKMFQLMVSAVAMDLVRRLLLGIEMPPAYFARYEPDQ